MSNEDQKTPVTEEKVLEAPTAAPAVDLDATIALPAKEVGDVEAEVVTNKTDLAKAIAEVVAAPVETPTPVDPEPAEEPSPVVFVPAPSAIPPVMKDAYALPLSASPSAKLNIEELKEFVAKMQPDVLLTPEQGGQQQTIFYQILIQAINTPAEDFGAVFALVTKIIRENLGGCFAPENMHRYTPHVTMPSASVTHFRNLLNALVALADPATRQIAVRQINVEQAFGDRKIKEESRQRVMSFFNL